MTMFFAKKLNKKGFTLAELLIVIAIVAVLVAIAIPIFSSSLTRARVTAHKANARAIKAAGGVAVLNNEALLGSTSGTSTSAGTRTYWKATATVDANGDLGEVSVVKDTSASAVSSQVKSGSGSLTDIDDAGDINPAGATYEVVFSDLEVKAS